MQQERSVTDEDLGLIEGRLEELRTALLTSEKELAEAQRDVSLQREEIHRIDEKNLVATERATAGRALIARLAREDEALEQERTRQGALREECQISLTTLAVREAGIAEDNVQRESELQETAQQVEEKKAEVRVLNELLLSAVQRNAERHAEHDRRRVRLEILQTNVKEVEEDNAAYAADLVGSGNFHSAHGGRPTTPPYVCGSGDAILRCGTEEARPSRTCRRTAAWRD